MPAYRSARASNRALKLRDQTSLCDASKLITAIGSKDSKCANVGVQASIPPAVIRHARTLATKIKTHELTCFPAVPGVQAQAQVMEQMHNLMIRQTFSVPGEDVDSIVDEWKMLVKLVEEAESDLKSS